MSAQVCSSSKLLRNHGRSQWSLIPNVDYQKRIIWALCLRKKTKTLLLRPTVPFKMVEVVNFFLTNFCSGVLWNRTEGKKAEHAKESFLWEGDMSEHYLQKCSYVSRFFSSAECLPLILFAKVSIKMLKSSFLWQCQWPNESHVLFNLCLCVYAERFFFYNSY